MRANSTPQLSTRSLQLPAVPTTTVATEKFQALEFLSPFLWGAPPLEMRRERREYFPDHAAPFYRWHWKRPCTLTQGCAEVQWQGQDLESLCMFPHTHPVSLHPRRKPAFILRNTYSYIQRAKRFCRCIKFNKQKCGETDGASCGLSF